MNEVLQGIASLKTVFDSFKSTRMLLVAGSSYSSLAIKASVDSLNADKVYFSGFSPNPIYEDVCKGVDMFVDEKCDAILAIGGGSAIDVAKCIKLAVLSQYGKKSLIPPLVSTKESIDGSKIPLVAIPTTAGTGSESTHNAVIYYKGEKQTVANDAIIPNFAILDTSVLDKLPLYQKKCTMMDALCQAIESWWSINANEESRRYSQKAIELIMSNWKPYIFDNDVDAAAQIMLGANYGGRAINLAQTTAAHAMSYKLTSMYKLPHGHAVAVCLPEIWEYMLAYDVPVFADIAFAMGCSSSKDAIALFRQMMKDMELQNPTFVEKNEELDILSKSVNPVRLKNNPVELTVPVLKSLYGAIVK